MKGNVKVTRCIGVVSGFIGGSGGGGEGVGGGEVEGFGAVEEINYVVVVVKMCACCRRVSSIDEGRGAADAGN